MVKSKVILSINAGSSSVKVTLFTVTAEGDQPEKIAAVEISGLSAPPAQFTYSRNDHKRKEELPSSIKSHNDAFQHILESLLGDKDLEFISSRDHIDYACHRVVHGVSGAKSCEHKPTTDIYRVTTRNRS